MNIETHIDVEGHMNRVRSEALWTYAATEWHRLYRPYVPFREGHLYTTVSISGGNGEGVVEHTAPYAHYAYEGRVMGPNIPIMQGGEIVGWFSPVAPKHYTGEMLKFTGMGSREWDQAAAPTQLPLLIDSIQRFVDSGHLNFAGE